MTDFKELCMSAAKGAGDDIAQYYQSIPGYERHADAVPDAIAVVLAENAAFHAYVPAGRADIGLAVMGNDVAVATLLTLDQAEELGSFLADRARAMKLKKTMQLYEEYSKLPPIEIRSSDGE